MNVKLRGRVHIAHIRDLRVKILAQTTTKSIEKFHQVSSAVHYG
jgi:hypothetical protein